MDEIRQIYAWRELLFILVQKNISLTYRQTYMGFLWVVIQPILMAVILQFVLGRFNQGDMNGVPYFLFLFIGYSFWSVVSKGISNGASSVTANKELVSKVFFPRAILPSSFAISIWVDLALVHVTFLVFILLYGMPFTVKMLFIPLPIGMTLIIAAGVSFWISALSTQFRDAQIFLPFALQIGQFVSPVLYPLSAVPDRFKLLYSLNPFVIVLELARWAAFDTYPLINAQSAAISGGSLVLITYGGYVAFRKMMAHVADYL
jgi:lipopolysaccharide transport system permease protein